MVNRECTVCDSPHATNYHFGARSCKACAAFFRRSIAMRQKYGCLAPGGVQPCKINYALRLNCRHCRLKKCKIAGMSEDLVQAKRDVKTDTRSRKPSTSEEITNTYVNPPGLLPPASTLIFNDSSSQLDFIVAPKPIEDLQFYPPSDNEWGYSPPEKVMKMNCDDLMEIEELKQFMSFPSPEKPTMIPRYHAPKLQHYGSLPSTSSYSSTESIGPESFYLSDIRTRLNSISEKPIDNVETIDYDKAYELAAFYTDQMFSLNMRRKVTYTEKCLSAVFDSACICPYEKSDLKLFDHRSYRQKNRNDYTMVLDYVNRFPGFNLLNKSEKTVLFRTAVGVDILVDQAIYSSLIYGDESVLVTPNGEYMEMDPLPTPEKDRNNGMFHSDEDFEKYRSLTSMKRQQWSEVVVPISKLNMSISEFALFKALTIWQYNYFKLQDSGKKVCEHQKEEIVKSLFIICADEGHENPEVRIADIILAMSHVMEQVHEMVTNYIEMQIFEVLHDPILKDILKFQY